MENTKFEKIGTLVDLLKKDGRIFDVNFSYADCAVKITLNENSDFDLVNNYILGIVEELGLIETLDYYSDGKSKINLYFE